MDSRIAKLRDFWQIAIAIWRVKLPVVDLSSEGFILVTYGKLTYTIQIGYCVGSANNRKSLNVEPLDGMQTTWLKHSNSYNYVLAGIDNDCRIRAKTNDGEVALFDYDQIHKFLRHLHVHKSSLGFMSGADTRRIGGHSKATRRRIAANVSDRAGDAKSTDSGTNTDA